MLFRSFLSSLLSLPPEEVICELLEVQSIIKIPGDDNEPIMLYHTSLQDFLTIQSQSKKYFIDPPLRHLHLAKHCLQHLVKYPSIDFFESHVTKYACFKGHVTKYACFESHVTKYACFNWPHHILLGFQKQELTVDETIMPSFVTLIEHLLTFQGKTWYNTMLTDKSSEITRVFGCVRDGISLFKVRYCNSQMVITLLTCVRHCRGQLLQIISSSYMNKLMISAR